MCIKMPLKKRIQRRLKKSDLITSQPLFPLLPIIIRASLFFSLVVALLNSAESNALANSGDAHENSNEEVRIFESNDILKLTIMSDFRSILDDRGEDRSYHKARLYYLNSSGDTIWRKIKLKTRGNFRRDPANCKYPPIMVKFGKLKTADSIFVDQSKLKLVIQCQLEEYVLLEYLAYRINNLLTDLSYRVRLAHITYADLETRETYSTRYAFFIENEEKLAERLNAEIYKPNVVQYFMERDQVISMAMFQYLIGNNDWYVTSKHNTSIMKLNESGDLISVPYDFDWSKMVDAQYTKPKDVPDYALKDRRIYKGLCLNEADLESQRQLFNSKKEVIVTMVQSIDGLPQKRKQVCLNFIEKFYKTLNRNSALKQIFQKEECVVEQNIAGK